METVKFGWTPEMPMTLLEKLKQDLKAAMREKHTVARDTVRQIMAEFPKLTVPIELESGKKTTRPKKTGEIGNEDIVAIVRGLAKSERTVLEVTGRSSSEYLDLLTAYLPQPVGREDISAWIAANVDLADFKSPMQAMGPVMKHFGKTADGNLVRQILQAMVAK